MVGATRCGGTTHECAQALDRTPDPARSSTNLQARHEHSTASRPTAAPCPLPQTTRTSRHRPPRTRTGNAGRSPPARDLNRSERSYHEPEICCSECSLSQRNQQSAPRRRSLSGQALPLHDPSCSYTGWSPFSSRPERSDAHRHSVEDSADTPPNAPGAPSAPEITGK